MATSPTVLAGASPAPTPVPAPAAAKFPLVSLLIAVGAGVLIAALGIGGGFYYLAHSGRLPVQSGASAKAETSAPVATRVIELEPMLVNLANEGGGSYLKASITLRVAEAVDKKGAKAKEEPKGADGVVAAVRDTILTVLGRQTAEELLASDGKEHLKEELKAALAKHNPDLKVADVFFTDFLVQR
jgi:flagellar protein FliL